MLREKAVGDQVYKVLFPYPVKNVDPSTWLSHVKNNLVTEIRTEVLMYYGDIDSLEAKFPGIDYNYAPHRRRLSRFHHHARLFQAFDLLGLTLHEVFELCNWEGTLYMKRKYEQEHNIEIEDTTLDCIPKPEPPAASVTSQVESAADVEDGAVQPKDEAGVEEPAELAPANVIQGEPLVDAAAAARGRPSRDFLAITAEEWDALVKEAREGTLGENRILLEAANRIAGGAPSRPRR